MYLSPSKDFISCPKSIISNETHHNIFIYYKSSSVTLT